MVVDWSWTGRGVVLESEGLTAQWLSTSYWPALALHMYVLLFLAQPSRMNGSKEAFWQYK